MSVEEKAKLQTLIQLVDNLTVDPDVDVNYFIPGVKVTTEKDTRDIGGPYLEFAYHKDGVEDFIQHMPITHGYMEKTPEDLANLVTFSLERFMEEVDSRQYGAQ